jgi:multimeric flavodoxin WrbA
MTTDPAPAIASDTPAGTSTGPDLTAVVLVGTLSPSPASSSSELLGRQVLEALATHGVAGTVVRLVDHDVKPGVEKDMGPGDAWPAIRRQVLAADILVLATPIWMGQPSSVTKRALERLDAELSEKDDEGRLSTYGKVAAVAVVGNEDGAHHVSAELFQALNDVGFTIPAAAVTYWVGRAMEGTDYLDLDETPETTAGTTATLAANTAHLARLLRGAPYPPA